jgi:hypothetical protein
MILYYVYIFFKEIASPMQLSFVCRVTLDEFLIQHGMLRLRYEYSSSAGRPTSNWHDKKALVSIHPPDLKIIFIDNSHVSIYTLLIIV